MAYKGKGKRVNRLELADVFGVAATTVDLWIKNGCPVLERSTGKGSAWVLDTAAIAAWLRDRAVSDAVGEGPGDEENLKLRRMKAETLKAELELAKARGEVAPLEQIERVVNKAFAEVRANMRNLPARVVSQLIGMTDEREFKSVLLGEIDIALESLAHASLADADAPDSDPDEVDGDE